MPASKPSREQLVRRRDEINDQLERVNTAQRIELDYDLQEQAIQVEHGEVATSMEKNLRRELSTIEDQLLEVD